MNYFRKAFLGLLGSTVVMRRYILHLSLGCARSFGHGGAESGGFVALSEPQALAKHRTYIGEAVAWFWIQISFYKYSFEMRFSVHGWAHSGCFSWNYLKFMKLSFMKLPLKSSNLILDDMMTLFMQNIIWKFLFVCLLCELYELHELVHGEWWYLILQIGELVFLKIKLNLLK